jgi:hypothetical protein
VLTRPTINHEDNLGVKQSAESGNFKGRSNHFDLRWRFLHHYINRGIVSIKSIKREIQLADLGVLTLAVIPNCKQWVPNYSFDLDSIFVSIQDFFWTLEFFSLQERGGGLNR